MPGPNAFRVEGVVTAVQANGTCRVVLANGHRLTGFFAGRDKRTAAPCGVGDTVKLQLTPYDLSTGRIVETRK
jgi:translation initiation factor IF-1